jgi:hypothetical protein
VRAEFDIYAICHKIFLKKTGFDWNNLKEKGEKKICPPRRGIEPRSPACGVLTLTTRRMMPWV